MEAAVHATAVSLLNSGRSFDGGFFRLVREARMFTVLLNNGTSAATDALVARLPGRIFTGGSVAMMAAAGVSALLLTGFAFCSFACAWRTVRRVQSRHGSYVAVSAYRREQLRDSQESRSISCLLAAFCMLTLAVTLIPLILASAANFRLHYNVAPASGGAEDGGGGGGPKENSFEDQMSRLLDSADGFMAGLTRQIRSEAAPVMREAEALTGNLKARAQAAYEGAFTRETGAAQLLAASDELLRRMADFYYAGRNLSSAMELLQAALGDLNSAQFFHYREACLKYHPGDWDGLCANHSRGADRLGVTVQGVRDDWTRANSSGDAGRSRVSLEAHAKNITRLLYQLVGGLDGSGNTPERQQEIRRRKLGIGNEMNRNITAVFERELNSTQFLVESVESQLRLLQEQMDSARVSLADLRPWLASGYANATRAPESARFGVTLGLLMLFFVCMVALAAGVAPIVLKSLTTGSRTRYFVGLLYLVSFMLIAAAIVFNTAMYTATAVLQAEACRYLVDTRSPANQTKGDEFLVPEMNDALAELRSLSVSDPNATQIPITAIESFLSALQYSCSDNLPLLVAVGGRIDESALDRTAETVAFQAKGLAILQREMRAMDLEQLRDDRLVEDLQNLKPFFRSYASTNFARLSRRLRPRVVSAAQVEAELAVFQLLNDRVDRLLPESETSVRHLSAMNAKSASRSLQAVDYLRQYASQFESEIMVLEAEKDVNSVVDQVIDRTRFLDVYLVNRSLWVETASQNYEKYIIQGTLNESLWIAKRIGAKFLSSIVRCRAIHEMYASAVTLPCSTVLQPLSILCFCIGWLLCCAVVLVLVSMFGFCRSRVWLTGIRALRGVESVLVGSVELLSNGNDGNGGGDGGGRRRNGSGAAGSRAASVSERRASSSWRSRTGSSAGGGGGGGSSSRPSATA